MSLGHPLSDTQPLSSHDYELASMASVLASSPVARAQYRAWRGLTRAIHSPASQQALILTRSVDHDLVDVRCLQPLDQFDDA